MTTGTKVAGTHIPPENTNGLPKDTDLSGLDRTREQDEIDGLNPLSCTQRGERT